MYALMIWDSRGAWLQEAMTTPKIIGELRRMPRWAACKWRISLR